MAFDFQRALNLGRQALRLVDALRDDDGAARTDRASGSGAGGRTFDPGLPPRRDGRPFDPTVIPDSWPTPPAGGVPPRDRRRAEERARQANARAAGRDGGATDGGARPTPSPSPRADAAAPTPGGHGVTRRDPAVLLPDFTGTARVEYAPVAGAAAGPGEVVWTWVPYEEMDGRGKDRPVLVVGRDGAHLLAVMLTSKDHTNTRVRDEDYVDVGSGPWDRTGRASEVKLDRVLRVDPSAVRREGGVLDEARFDAVADALAREHGWAR